MISIHIIAFEFFKESTKAYRIMFTNYSKGELKVPLVKQIQDVLDKARFYSSELLERFKAIENNYAGLVRIRL